LKRFCIKEVGIPLQCIQPQKFNRGDPNKSVLTKVVVQMNCKVGGTPWAVELTDAEDIMICGVDLYHSGELLPNSNKKKSVVGFCASLGGTHTNFYSNILAQESGTDIAETLAPSLSGALEAYKTSRGQYPKHIIVYRDGVGKTQIAEAFSNELTSMTDVVLEILEKHGADIQLNYIITLKRITTRLLRAADNQNPRPGTVVDTAITEPGKHEFYMVSHNDNLGSAAPIKYQVLSNGSQFDADYYQMLTNRLCSAYYNWWGPIKVPAHCMYAHTLAKVTGAAGVDRERSKLKDKLYFL
jgi:aubergine-like protein